MLRGVEREAFPTSGFGYPVPPISSACGNFPPRQPDIPVHMPGLRREGTRSKHHSMLNHLVSPPTSPLAQAPGGTQRSNTHLDYRADALASSQRQATTFAVSASAPASSSMHLPQALLKPATVTDTHARPFFKIVAPAAILLYRFRFCCQILPRQFWDRVYDLGRSHLQ